MNNAGKLKALLEKHEVDALLLTTPETGSMQPVLTHQLVWL